MPITNSDILRRLRYVFDYNDPTMISIFGLVDYEVSQKDLNVLLKKKDDPKDERCSDRKLAIFLNGLIVKLRGKKDGPHPQPEDVLTNNIILRKLKIALNLQAEDLIAILQLAGFKLGKHELSAFFRKPSNVHYRLCKDQALRNFLTGLRLKYRGAEDAERG
jgi:uncharacterized protein YehS (DUF1456 family)